MRSEKTPDPFFDPLQPRRREPFIEGRRASPSKRPSDPEEETENDEANPDDNRGCCIVLDLTTTIRGSEKAILDAYGFLGVSMSPLDEDDSGCERDCAGDDVPCEVS